MFFERRTNKMKKTSEILKEELDETNEFLKQECRKEAPEKNDVVSYLIGKMDGLIFAIKALEKEEEAERNDDIKQRIDEAEKELRELFNDLIYEHCDNEGEYELNNLSSGFNTLLKYAREWQKNGEH